MCQDSANENTRASDWLDAASWKLRVPEKSDWGSGNRGLTRLVGEMKLTARKSLH